MTWGNYWDSSSVANGSWRDADEGNRLAVKHGARSPRLISEEAERVRAELTGRMEFLGDPMFAPALRRCAEAQARANLLSDYIWAVVEGVVEARPHAKGGATTGVEGVPPYLWTELARAEANAQKFAQECGLDPIGFARLAKELGWAKQLAGARVSDLVSRGRALRRGSPDADGGS